MSLISSSSRVAGLLLLALPLLAADAQVTRTATLREGPPALPPSLQLDASSLVQILDRRGRTGTYTCARVTVRRVGSGHVTSRSSKVGLATSIPSHWRPE